MSIVVANRSVTVGRGSCCLGFWMDNTPSVAPTSNFINLTSPTETNFELEEEEVLPGDFTISTEFTNEGEGSGQFLLSGGIGSEGLEIYKNSSGFISIYYGGVSLGGGGSIKVDDKKLHRLILRRIGTSATVTLDGVEHTSFTLSGICRIKVIGRRRDGTFYWSGIIANLNINGTIFELNSSKSIEYSRNSTFGSELYLGNHLVAGGATLSSNTATSDATNTWFYIAEDYNSLEVGALYRVIIDFDTNSTLGTPHIWDLDNSYADIISVTSVAKGEIELIFIATSPNIRVGIQWSGGIPIIGDWITINSQSVTKVTGKALRYNNIVASNRLEFTKDGDDYLGSEELWDDNNIINIVGDWARLDLLSYQLNGSNGTLLRPSGDPITSFIRVTFTYTAIVGTLRVGSSLISNISTSGQHIVEGFDSTAFGFKRGSGLVQGTLTAISVRRLLKLADQAEAPAPQSQEGRFGVLTQFDSLDGAIQ